MDAAGARALKDRIEAHQAVVARRLRAIARSEHAEGDAEPSDRAGLPSSRAEDESRGAPGGEHAG
jgi:hypothetical protein